jgi:hypothetical protein
MNWRLHERRGTRDIEDDDGCAGVLDIGGYERVEAFLAGSIPELHPQALVLHIDGLGDEVDSDCGLHRRGCTCSLPVKLSKMKRFIMEVLPTDWSPSKTILHFTAGLFYIFFQIL